MNLNLDIYKMTRKELEMAFIKKVFTEEENAYFIEGVKEEYFAVYNEEIKAIKRIYNKTREVNLIELTNAIGQEKALELVVPDTLYDTIKMESIYNEIIKRSNMDKILKTVKGIYEKGIRNKIAPEEALSELKSLEENIIFSSKPTELCDLIEEAYVEILDEKEGENTIKTGIDNIDNIIKEIERNNYVVIGARPGCGKTALALQIALNNVMANKRVMYITMEMSDKEMVKSRVIKSQLGLTKKDIKKGLLGGLGMKTAQEIAEFPKEIRKLKGMCFEPKVHDNVELIQKIKNQAAKDSLDLIVIDYIGLIKSDGTSYSREREVAEISRDLKILTRDYEIPILCLTQLNRGGADGEPDATSIRESDALLNDANKVMLLWNDEEETKNLGDDNKGVVNCKITKNREGKCGVAKLLFDKKFQKITSYNL